MLVVYVIFSSIARHLAKANDVKYNNQRNKKHHFLGEVSFVRVIHFHFNTMSQSAIKTKKYTKLQYLITRCLGPLKPKLNLSVRFSFFQLCTKYLIFIPYS